MRTSHYSWTLFCSIDFFVSLYAVIKLLVPTDLGFDVW